MKPRLTFIHGWGYDVGLWQTLLPLLGDFDTECVDLGFFGAPTEITPCEGERIVVGHSLGILWWLTHSPVPWTRMLSINGFSKFTATADFPQGVAPRVLARMQKRFAESPAEVLVDFQTSCGCSGPALPADTVPLSVGLEWLAMLDARAALAARSADVWALASGDDPIVPAALSSAAFAELSQGRLRWLESNGHLLPLTHAQECAALIRELAV